MVKKLIKLLFLLLLFTFYSTLFAEKSHAADFSLGIYPPILQIQATAPTVISKDITLVNASSDEITVGLVYKLFDERPGDSGQVEYLPASTIPSPDKDIFHRIQILDGDNPITEVVLAPKQKRIVTLRIALPKDEPGGDYYFSIVFLSKQNASNLQNNTHITAGIATNVLLSIGPKDGTTGFLSEFSAPFFVQTGPIPFTVSISNTSRHFISPTGHILVRNMFGQLIGQVDLLSTNILGKSSRYMVNKKFQEATTNGHPAALWNEKVLFGIYRANIVVSLSDEGPLFTRTIYFFAIPWEYLLGGCIAIIIIAIVLARVHKRVTNH